MTAIASKTTHHCMIIIIPWIKTTASYDDVTVLMTRVIYIVEFLKAVYYTGVVHNFVLQEKTT